MGLCSVKGQKKQMINEKKELSTKIQTQHDNSQELYKIYKSDSSGQSQQNFVQTPKKQNSKIIAPNPQIKSIKRTAWADQLIENTENRGTLKNFISLKNTSFSKHYSIVNQDKIQKIKFNEQYLLIEHNLSGKVRVAELIQKNNYSEQLIQEIIQSQLQHPNMIKIFDIYQDNQNYEIIHDFYNGKTLQQNLNLSIYSEKQIAIIIKQIIELIQYLHHYGFNHNFLTLKSFQTSENLNQNFIKLIDYKSIYSKHKNMSKDYIHYLSPEAIKIPDMYTFERDIWSIGIILYVLFTRKYPFEGSNLEEIYEQITIYSQTNELDFEGIPQQCIKLIKQFLQINPKNRIKLNEALDNEWLYYLIQESKSELKIVFEQIDHQHLLTFLQCCFLQFMISTFQQDQELHYYQIFRQFDSNHDGKLNRKDLIQAYLKYNSNLYEIKEKVEAIFKGMDQNKNGEIDFQEFLIGVIDRNLLITEDNIKEAFKLLSDCDGHISLQKMVSLYSNKKQILKTSFSIYQNQQINYQQFQQLMFDAI